MAECSRWEELGDSLKFAAEFAFQSKCLTEFRLLNQAEAVVIGDPNATAETEDASKAKLFELLANGTSTIINF